MKVQILNTMKLAFVIKLLSKDMFFTLAPIPDFIQTKDSSSGMLDIELKSSMPEGFKYKFFISKNSTELRLGNFYSVEVLNDSDRVVLIKHVSYEDQDEVLLDDTCCICRSNSNFGCSKELLDTLKSLFEDKLYH